ncbi:MAG TPA: DUF4157 domain-containing protein [Thermoanaerobaculia bacterium]
MRRDSRERVAPATSPAISPPTAVTDRRRVGGATHSGCCPDAHTAAPNARAHAGASGSASRSCNTHNSSAPPPRGHLFSEIAIHPPQPLPSRALTTNAEVHLGDRSENLAQNEFDALLAHEAVHTLQQRGGGKRGDVLDLEWEAHALAPAILAGRAPAPQWSADPSSVLHETPREKLVVERAKKRLALLQKYMEEYSVRAGRRAATKSERDEQLAKRRKMDEEGPEPVIAMQKRWQEDEARMAAANKRPLSFDVTEEQVRIDVNFEVRFDDPQHEAKFATLVDSLQKGIDTTWNKRLSGGTFGGRKLVIVPHVKKIAANASRNLDAWLITVRATDQGPVSFPGCSLPQPPAGDPTSVTEPLCAGGVMSIPPLHMSKPDVLGHELFHLFGFVDRYATYQYIPPRATKPITELSNARATGGRLDPLGADTGPALREDLVLLFDKYGIYEMEENRGLATLRDLERQGLNVEAVSAEMQYLEEIIATGHDPKSLIRIRKDFTDKMIKSAEDLD